jgi:hypothetical protein
VTLFADDDFGLVAHFVHLPHPRDMLVSAFARFGAL